MRKTLLQAGCLLALLATSCSRDKFAEVNSDPDVVQVDRVDPKAVFPTAPIAIHANDFEAYYDIHRNMEYWIGAWVPIGGNGVIITRFRTPVSASTFPYRYENLYTRESIGAGGSMREMRNIIDKMPPAEGAKYQHMRAITYIPAALAAFNVTDIMGSIAYSEAFQARYAEPPIFKPKYDTQEALYDTLNNQLKASVAELKKTGVEQEVLGASDLWFRGVGTEATNWIMAANSFRMRIAMRMLKRKPAAAKAIIDEVLADNVGPINAREFNWNFKGGPNVANGGNYNLAAGISGQKAAVDFMYKTTDPRMRNIYAKVALTQADFNTYKANGTIAATEVYQEYRGRPTSPDAVGEADKRFYFNYIFGTTAYVSYINQGMFNASVSVGLVNFPVITYADVCFMRAELAARGVTGEAAADWYYKGIEASIADYDEWGKDAKVPGYTAFTPAEVTAYKNQADIVYNPAKGIEQICIQQYFNFWRNPNEMWAVIKRTGFPSQTGVVFQAEKIRSGGIEAIMPRRWSLFVPPISDLNYDNRKASVLAMQADPELGDLSDITGRVWWDKK
ncbi:SusD/RagB family nutrient-binding outer membrane lipoprotein [Chitinophaga sp. SYP-B3965]|uniref:SusD/RagB family nutrient-binding outer membrane lipoprotein n=1 Tax=Chitinophaga sp. SYP-B3965 TaxID=2663120 RepID=UPI001299BF02|nr:SusD/RagB family nutrient-binding outer membrane lipoprotein [Chitinophaga sp. SYP-B3965]MRG43572.1 SusD/RagB family nutrient-binding outer membrane lipoprotein [Chitinophaga sp. SYP-B3965]